MMTYSDEYLDHWGDVYTANLALFRARRVLFETFLVDPFAIFTAVVYGYAIPLDVIPFYPLLPAQKAVQERLINQELDEYLQEGLELALTQVETTGEAPVRGSNGALIEPLKHHAHPERRMFRSQFRGRQCG